MATIRRATLEDADAIAAVHMASWQHGYRGLMPDDFLDQLDVAERAARWRRNLSDPVGTTFVLEDELGRIAGFCSLLPAADPEADPTVGLIAALYVDPASWRAGIGTALMQTTTQLARERGYEQLWLWVLEGNHNARRFYESLGYRADGTQKTDSFGGGPPAPSVRYRRRIGAAVG